MRIDILDKNEILLAHIIPTGANPAVVKPLPTPKPTEPINLSGTMMNTFFLFKLLYFFNKIHYQI